MLEIKNEISDTINKITEHLEFLGYKIEKDKELLLAYYDTNNNEWQLMRTGKKKCEFMLNLDCSCS